MPPRTAARAHETATSTATIDRLADQRAWITNGGWMNPDLQQALLERFPMLAPADLPTLQAHAAAIEALELGSEVTPP